MVGRVDRGALKLVAESVPHRDVAYSRAILGRRDMLAGTDRIVIRVQDAGLPHHPVRIEDTEEEHAGVAEETAAIGVPSGEKGSLFRRADGKARITTGKITLPPRLGIGPDSVRPLGPVVASIIARRLLHRR